MYDKDKRHKVEKQSTERSKELHKALDAAMPSHNWHDIMGSRYIHPVNVSESYKEAIMTGLQTGTIYTSMHVSDELIELKQIPREVIYYG